VDSDELDHVITSLWAGLLGGLVVGVQGPDGRMGRVVARTHGTHVYHGTASANLVIDVGGEVLLKRQ